jgi:tetratricopeptide (TPR) repeat protein/tRNA A-37 threonylcarbamoyl transferase component Bud32
MEDLQERAEQIFVTVLGLDPSERAAYLRTVYRRSPEIRVRVEKMLKEDELAGSFLERPLFNHLRFEDIRDEQVAAQDMDSRAGDGSGPRSHTPQFIPGEILCDRFHVVRFIAKGGMGEVYEVEDRELRGVHVALKTILSKYASDPLIQDRFEREVLNAREVVHPNLCPIYDIFHWNRHEGRLTFLTMKLLVGETLSARLARIGPLPDIEASLIIAQIGAGLSAAHNAGILHRDIKAANIILDGFGEKVYSCVTDFGLARTALAETTALTLNGIAGTPSYMAPELFYGGSSSKASDVFSFGVVVYQTLTGRLPRLSLNHTPDGSVAALAQSLPPPWRQLLNGCLEPDLDRRFKDIPSALHSLAEAPVERIDHVRNSPFLTRRKMIALTATGCLAVAGGSWLERERLMDWLEPLPSKRFVALMAWPTGESQSVVLTILDSIGNRLARAEAYVKDLLIITFNDIPDNADVPKSPTLSVAALGANLVLAVSLHANPSLLTLSLAVLDAMTQKRLRRIDIKRAPDQLSSMVEEASKAALALLGLPPGEPFMNDQEELKRISPATFRIFSDAEQLAAEPNDAGLTAAILKYQQALTDDPHFALGYASLAKAHLRLFAAKGDVANLGLGERNAALSLRFNPNSASGLFSEGLTLLYLGKPNEAVDFFAKSLRNDPGNPEITLNKAWAFRNLGRYTDAEQAFRDIIKERPNYWPAYDALGWVLWRQAKYQEAANAYDAAANAAPNVALPLANLGALYLELGKHDEAITALNGSLKRSPSDEALVDLGDIAFEDGKYTAALDYYQRAAQQNPKIHMTWRDIADCYAVLGKPALVQKNYAKAAEILSDFVAINPRDGTLWATLAFYHAKIHDSAHAEADMAKAQGASDVESQFMIVQALAVLGKREEALQLLLKCMDRGLAPIEVDGALDLASLRKDPRYLSRVQKLRTKDGLKAS